MSNTRVLALSMRPKSLKDLAGQEDLIAALSSQVASGRIPHFFLISAQIGAGKTTIARILALWLQVQTFEFSEQNWRDYKKYEIKEINAANHTGVDDMRKIIDSMRYQPLYPSRAKVVILDEAHQLSAAAQNALITETEDVAEHVYYIFCTSSVNKIIPALRRRAFVISPRPLSSSAVDHLVNRAKETVSFKSDTADLTNALIDNTITSPGLVLQAAERFFSGMPAEESVLFSEASKLDTMALCRAVASGDWSKCGVILKDVTKSDVFALRACVTGYLKAILLKSSGEKAYCLSKAIVNISSSSPDDAVCLPSFLAALCLACQNVASSRLVRPPASKIPSAKQK